jgi:lipopolysaccharide export system protein LptA
MTSLARSPQVPQFLPRSLSLALASLAALAVLGLGGADAQISQRGGPIMIGSDELEVIESEGFRVWPGRPEAIQDDVRLRADELRVLQARTGSGFGDVSRIEAIGNVYFVSDDQVVRGDRAVYTLGDDTLVVSGDVILNQGENVLTGSRLTVRVSTGRSTMEGAQTPGAGRRVQGVFYPGGTNR